MASARVTVEGFVAKDPELVTSTTGKPVAKVSVPVTPQRKNSETGRWEDSGPTVWYEAAFWDEQAHAVVSQLRKGTLVRLEGVPSLNLYEGKNGTAATVVVKAPTVSVVVRASRSSAGAVAPAPEGWAQPSAESWPTGEPVWNAPTVDSDTPF